MLAGAIVATIVAILVVGVFSAQKKAPVAAPASGSDWWPPGMAPKQRLRFEQLLLAYFAKRGEQVRLVDGCAINGEDMRDGLQNIAQRCAQADEREWPTLIGDHFDNMQRSKSEQDDLARRVGDFDAVAELLVPRLWNEDLPDREQMFVLREDLEGTRTVLSFDLPSCVTNVRPDNLAAWSRPVADVFDRALENLAEKHPVEVGQHDLGDGFGLWILGADHFYAASHALLLDRYPGCVGPGGALVAIPHRHVLLSYPIESMQAAIAVNKLVPIAMGMFREGPGSITPNLYWYRNGRFQRIPYELGDKELQIRPPEGFIELLGELAKREQEPA